MGFFILNVLFYSKLIISNGIVTTVKPYQIFQEKL